MKMLAQAVVVTSILGAAMPAPIQAAAPSQGHGHLGLMLTGDVEYGGDNVVTLLFANGSTQKIHAGQGGSIGIGAHYQPAASPWDFSATVGSKFVLNASSNSDLKITRVVFKLAGTYNLANGAWVTLGPVLHTGTKLDGDSFVPDVSFDSSFGALLGVGWRWVGVTYTNMKYKGPFAGSIDASSVGVNVAWRR
jgi:hypothetical protein